MQVELTPDQKALIDEAIQSGRFATAEAALCDALTLWGERERRLAEMRAAVNEAEEPSSHGQAGTHNAASLSVKLSGTLSLRALVRHVIAQAMERQNASPGTDYAGATLLCLVAAKLGTALPLESKMKHLINHSADSANAKSAEFLIGDVSIHVTTSPCEALIADCGKNLNDGLRPMLITLNSGVIVAEGLAANAGLGDRIDIFDVEQFLALNLYRLGKFTNDSTRAAVNELVERYNALVEQCEADSGWKIQLVN